MLYCTKCGVELETDIGVCPICGQPVSGKNNPSERIEGKRKKAASHEKLNWGKIKQFLTDRIPPFKRIFHI